MEITKCSSDSDKPTHQELGSLILSRVLQPLPSGGMGSYIVQFSCLHRSLIGPICSMSHSLTS